MLQLSQRYSCSESTINNKLKINKNKQVLEKIKTRKVTWKKSKKEICCFEGCNKIARKGDYCEIHYSKIIFMKYIEEYINRHKSKVIDTIIRKTNKFIVYDNFIVIEIYEKNKIDIKIKTLVSKKHLNSIIRHTWNLHSQGYIECRINKDTMLLHRFITNNSNEFQIDHIDGNKLNNLDDNLRIVNASQNQMNKKLMNNNTSGVCGVTWDKSRQKWKVSINYDNHCINLGRFDNLEEAKKVRQEAENKYHNEYKSTHRYKY